MDNFRVSIVGYGRNDSDEDLVDAGLGCAALGDVRRVLCAG